MKPTHLHYYKCRICSKVKIATAKAQRGELVHCLSCNSWMRFLFSEPITTDEHRAIAAKGFVWRQVEPIMTVPWNCAQCDEENFGVALYWNAHKFCSNECRRGYYDTHDGPRIDPSAGPRIDERSIRLKQLEDEQNELMARGGQ